MIEVHDHILELVFCNLGLPELLACSGTCKRFNTIITSSAQIQLFLYKQLVGHTFVSTPSQVKNNQLPGSGQKKRSYKEQLSRLLQTEHHLSNFHACLNEFKLPEYEAICAIGEECIITSDERMGNVPTEDQPDCTLITVWKIEGGKDLKFKPLKVDFQPHSIHEYAAVDIENNIIICLESENGPKGARYVVRSMKIFGDNGKDFAEPHESDEMLRKVSYPAWAGVPHIELGTNGLLVIDTHFSKKWTRWTEGKDLKWGTIEKLAYCPVGNRSRLYGSDILAAVGECQIDIMQNEKFSDGMTGPIKRDYLLIYHLDDQTRHIPSKPRVILRMPYSIDEWPGKVRSYINQKEPGEAVWPTSLTDSNNG
ncbi:uncharacterized protein L201_005313 [Kwoniella dendrophila CBS 6074]|uniref:F-box domain-containing protein n=1 Tax=Kwoniella dendrophila CBS 6074 TaxID=1295534 RepID=A0AAX4K0R9_9TREE